MNLLVLRIVKRLLSNHLAILLRLDEVWSVYLALDVGVWKGAIVEEILDVFRKASRCDSHRAMTVALDFDNS